MNIHTRKRSQWQVKVARLQGSAALSQACRDHYQNWRRQLLNTLRGGL